MSSENPTTEGGGSASADSSPIDVDEFTTTNYAIPAQKSVKELLESDKEDESLRKSVKWDSNRILIRF
jgi:hypothetical protein